MLETLYASRRFLWPGESLNCPCLCHPLLAWWARCSAGTRDSTRLTNNIAFYKNIPHLISSSGHPREGGREADIINSI